MKSERGVTITAIMIYVLAFTVVVVLVTRMTTYFYKNVDQVKSNTIADTEYTKFTSYFTEEINMNGNTVREIDSGKKYIIFGKSGNEYKYENNTIYRNNVKICRDVETCEFYYNKETKEIDVNLKIQDKYYSSKYTIVK